jgi:putative spermidine/putrescine transport system ATP-binding protein
MRDANVPRSVAATARAADAVAVEVSIERISHRYDRVLAVDDVSLQIRGGELVALLGPSGCGKTTLLRIVAGLLSHSEGRLRFANRIVDALPPSDRGAGIVFQNYALFPHMTAAENIGYGLRARGAGVAAIRATVERMLKLVQMEGFSERLPRELSGGQQQRVALARTLAVNRRALRGARQESAAGHADRDQAHPARTRHHHHHRHA